MKLINKTLRLLLALLVAAILSECKTDGAISPTISILTNAGPINTEDLSYGNFHRAVSGIASSRIGVDRVEVRLNDGPVVVANISIGISTRNVPWWAQIQPVIGLNRLVATVYDLAGNSSASSRTFTFEQRSKLIVTGGYYSRYGHLTTPARLFTTPAINASALTQGWYRIEQYGEILPLGTSFSEVIPGTVVRLVAKAPPNHFFSHWFTDSAAYGATFDIPGDVISFIMPEGYVFVVPYFIPSLSNVTPGKFCALVHPNAGTISSNETEGFVSGFLYANAKFRGRLLIGGQQVTFTGWFHSNGEFSFSDGGNIVPELNLGGGRIFDMSTFTAKVTNATLGVSSGTLHPEEYSSYMQKRWHYKVPSSLLNSATRGTYTLRLPSKEQSPSLATSSFPQGDGIAIIRVHATGAVDLAGTLADGTAFTTSSHLVSGNKCPFFVQLKTPGSKTSKGGSFGGMLTFDPTQTDSDVSGVDLHWFRPAVPQPTTRNPVMDLYTDGWPSGINVDAVGALYDATQTVQNSLGITENAIVNTDLVFANLRYRIDSTTYSTKSLSFAPQTDANTVFTLLPTNSTAYTLSVAPSTGFFSGNVSADSSSKPFNYRGIIIQKGTNKGGYGYVISTAVGDRDPESGGVRLLKK